MAYGSEFPFFVGPLVLATEIVVMLVLFLGLRATIPAAEPFRRRHRRVGVAIAAGLVVWFIVDVVLAMTGLFAADATGEGSLVPPIAFGIGIPLVIGLAVVLRSSSVGDVLVEIPPSWLVGVQIYRAIGYLFIYLYARALLPGVFALPAGYGDVLVGVAAVPVAYALARHGRRARGLALAWSIVGIGDLIAAVGLGFLSSPGRFQVFAYEAPNVLMGAFPMVMVPLFAVPLSIMLHAASLRQLYGRPVVAPAPA